MFRKHVLTNAKLVQRFEPAQLRVTWPWQRDHYPIATTNYNNSVWSSCQWSA